MTPRHLHHRPRRQGFTLVEVMVVMAILVIIAAIGIPSLQGLLDMQQRAAAKELAQTYTWLIDEAALRNVTFRVALNLDRSTWTVEVGDPDTLIFSDPTEREAFEDNIKSEMSRFTQREVEEGEAEDVEAKTGRFSDLSGEDIGKPRELPSGSRFGFVYTPQYGPDGMEPSDEVSDDPEDDRIAYTYIFPDGSSEHIVVRLVGDDDPEDGYTVEVEPISGKVRVVPELLDPEDSLRWIPEDGPELP